MEKNLFPQSSVTNLKLEGFALVIEHEKIFPIVLPNEWSFSMLKDAALLTIQVAEIAAKYTYNMKDAHGLNVLFDGMNPKFIDLGSFEKNQKGTVTWKPYEEFLRFYYYPLTMWSYGNAYLGKMSIYFANLTTHCEFYIYKNKFYALMPKKLLDRFILLKFITLRINTMSFKAIEEKFSIRRQKQLKFMKKIMNFLKIGSNGNFKKARNKISKVRKKYINSAWAGYHTEIQLKRERFRRVVQYVNEIDEQVTTAIDIAGNQGDFTTYLLENTDIQRAICLDYDEQAIDTGYLKNKNIHENLTYITYDFMGPVAKLSWPLPHERFSCDIAFCLALTHHLLLTQKYDIDTIFLEISKYSKKYVFVEFMPLGLWVTGAEVNVPAWYTVDWFQKNFEEYFVFLKVEKIATNNILFIGEVKNG